MRIIKKVIKGNRTTIKLFNCIKISYKNTCDKHKNTDDKLLENIFKKDYKKKVLLSYITAPFKGGLYKTHSNSLEAMTAAKIFDSLRYQVDAIFYLDDLPPEKLKDYDVVYGFGKTFDMTLTNPKIKSIFYGTGCSTLYSNVVTVKKIREVCNNHGIWMPNCGRIVYMPAEISLNFSDLIITLGNEFVKNTYVLDGVQQNIKNINCFYYDTYNIDMDKKDFNKIRKNFLFFGSGGTLHKGLDIVINIFKKRTDLNLTICGNYDYEPNFKNYYSNVFENKFSNIKFAGFVNIESDEFKNIMDNNAAVIFPSLSEGGAVAILNVMANGGLIPIISESSGLDVGHYGFMFQEISEKNVEQYIDKFLQLDIDKLRELSTSVKNETRHLYSYDKYKTNLAQIINNELKEGFGVDNTHGNMPDTVVASE